MNRPTSLGPAGAGEIINGLIENGAAAYDRQRHLPFLIAIEPAVLADDSAETSERIMKRLDRALRGERQRGRAGHWAYDLNRHIALTRAYRAELEISNSRRRAGEGGEGGKSRQQDEIRATDPPRRGWPAATPCHATSFREP